ncbi:hypothetical protein D3C76_132120 [compost metagenome]
MQMKKRLTIGLTFFIFIGLFTICLPVFASNDAFQRIHDLNRTRMVAMIKIFISIAAISLIAGLGKAMFLYSTNKNIYGAKNAFLRILFHPHSLLSTNMRDLQRNTSFTQYKQALASKLGKGIAFGLDTNILMHLPNETFELLKNENILISREVQKELDGLKNSSDKTVSSNARRAFKTLEDAQIHGQQIIILPSTDFNTVKGFGLSDTADDRIVAAYLKYNKEKGSTCFISNDRGVKLTARNAGLSVLEVTETSSLKNNKSSKLIGAMIISIVLLAGYAGYNILVILSFF